MTRERALILNLERYAQHYGSCPTASMSGPCNCDYKELETRVREYLKETEEIEDGTHQTIRDGFNARGTETGRTSARGSGPV